MNPTELMLEKCGLCKPRTITIPQVITPDALSDMTRYIRDNWDRPYNDTGGKILWPRPDCLDGAWNEWMVKDGEYAGTWPKRYATMCIKSLGVRPPEKMVATLGEIAARYSKAASFIFDITNECNWDSGDFGEDENSCWWGEFSGARIGLFDNGGFAIRFYEDIEQAKRGTRGVGRAWIFHDKKQNLVVFNGYHRHGKVTHVTYARALATFLGLSYRRVDLSVDHAYINGDSAYMIGAPEDLTENCLYLDFANPQYTCYECDSALNEDEVEQYNDRDYCADCFNDNFFHCYRCGEAYSNDDGYNDPSNNLLCEDCFTLRYFNCSNCGEPHSLDARFEADGDDLCEDCFDENYVICYKCDDAVERDVAEEINSRMYCDNCYKICNTCGECFVDGGHLIDSMRLCDACFDDAYAICSCGIAIEQEKECCAECDERINISASCEVNEFVAFAFNDTREWAFDVATV